MNADYPYRFNVRGRTALAEPQDHVRDLIEQVLFTAPGERVNRPDFGSGLWRLVFEPGGDTIAAALQADIMASLHRWLSDLIFTEEVTAESDGDGALLISVRYVLLRTRERRTEQFTYRESIPEGATQ